MNSKKHWPLYMAEFIGTFVLVFFGCGSMIAADTVSGYNPGFIPLVWGGAVSIMIYTVGHISGAHFNPAVSLGFYFAKRFPANRLFGYISAQVAGAIMASVFHLMIWGSGHSFGMTQLQIGMSSALIMEFVLSFTLMFVIISVATDSRAVGEMAGIAIGSTVAICAFVGGPLTGASMNPARSLGPAIVAMDFSNIAIYIFIPIFGAALGALCYEWIRCSKTDGGNSEMGCC